MVQTPTIRNVFLRPIRSLSAPMAIAETIADRLAPIRMSEETLFGRPFTTLRKVGR